GEAPELPAVIQVYLLADGVRTGQFVELTVGNGWSGLFAGLPEKKDGQVIQYTVEEVAVDGFKSEITGNSAVGFTITNRYEKKIDIPVKKVWEIPAGEAPELPAVIQVYLLADGERTGQFVELTAENDWSGLFAGLLEKKDGQVIQYTVEEVVVDGFKSEITGNSAAGFTIVNRYLPPETTTSSVATTSTQATSTRPTEPPTTPTRPRVPSTGDQSSLYILVFLPALGLILLRQTWSLQKRD
ncbi:MAG: Cna B-type domain-containing protein, partial [Eubacteriales bacterium]|nr:Cna B-type domain-containing protein [Eubacteriales bacterium]